MLTRALWARDMGWMRVARHARGVRGVRSEGSARHAREHRRRGGRGSRHESFIYVGQLMQKRLTLCHENILAGALAGSAASHAASRLARRSHLHLAWTRWGVNKGGECQYLRVRASESSRE